MKFSGYLLLYEESSAIDFGPDRSIPVVGPAPKVGQNELDCSSVCEWDKNFQRCYRFVLFINLGLAVPKMGQMSKSGTFPKCEMVLQGNLSDHRISDLVENLQMHSKGIEKC